MNSKQLLVCNIAIVPSDALTQKALMTSDYLQKYDEALFVLGAKTNVPHCSLYMLQLKQADINKASGLLGQVAKITAVQQLSATMYMQNAGYIDISYDCSASLRQLQNRVLQAINPIARACALRMLCGCNRPAA